MSESFYRVALIAADLPQYRDLTISTDLKMGYQLVVADLNGDSEHWTRHTLDAGGIAAADCEIANFSGTVLACVGGGDAPGVGAVSALWRVARVWDSNSSLGRVLRTSHHFLTIPSLPFDTCSLRIC
jgi:hypothetical protein